MHCTKCSNAHGHDIKHHHKSPKGILNLSDARRDHDIIPSKCSHPSHIIIPPFVPPSEVIVTSGIISLNPSQGPSIGSNPIVINGFNLLQTSSVTMNGITIPFTLLSNNQLQIVASPQTTNQLVQITAYFHNGSSESLSYTYINNASITILSPSSGPMTGGNIISIAGTGLSSTRSVYFNNIITFNFVIYSDTNIQVSVPNLTGQSNILVHVTTATGSSNDLSYQLVPPPII